MNATLNCQNCPFRYGTQCRNPKNIDIKRRQFKLYKLLNKRFFPDPPAWCKLRG